MKTIGLIGGASPASTLEYYRIINKKVNEILGNQHSAKIVLASVDFEEITEPLFSNNWTKIGDILSEAALQVQNAGADFFIICSNTLHQAIPMIKLHIQLPLMHILQPTCTAISTNEFKRIALLGTEYTMQNGVHSQYIKNHCSALVVTPETNDQRTINEIIFNELCHGIVTEESKNTINDIIARLQKNKGIDAVILGCTELPLLFENNTSRVSLLNTTSLHAVAVAKYAVGNLDKIFLWDNQDESIRTKLNLHSRLETRGVTSNIAVGF